MPRKRPVHRPRRWTAIQLLQVQHPLLGGVEDPFTDDAERELCWQQNRERMMADMEPGRRPGGWWDYESPEPRDRSIPEREQLRRMGALRPDELAKLLPFPTRR